MKIKLLLTALFLTSFVNSQTLTRSFPLPETTEYYTGSCAPIVNTPDGGYILNYSYSYFNYDVAPPYFSEYIKTDSNFVPIWRKEIFGGNGKATFIFNDGSSIFYANSNGLKIEKIDSFGQTVWSKGNYEEYAKYIHISNAVLNNGNIKLAGEQVTYNGFGYINSSFPILMDIDTNGNAIQVNSLTNSSTIYKTIDNIASDNFGNYYITGNSSEKEYIAKINSSNSVVWCKSLQKPSSPTSYYFTINSTIILNNGDILIGGYVNNYAISINGIYLVRLTSNGNLVWSKTIDYNSSAQTLQELPDGNIIVTGFLRKNNDTDYWNKNIIIKIDSNGNSLWSKLYNDGFSISTPYQKTTDDWYYTAFSDSTTSNSPFLFNTDSNGDSSCIATDFPLTFHNMPLAVNSLQATLIPFTIGVPTDQTSNTISNQPYTDDCLTLTNADFEYSDKIVLYPNPTNGVINISSKGSIDEIKVVNVFGQIVYQSKLNAMDFSFEINNSGIYLVTISSGKEVQTTKVIVNK